LTTMTAGVQLIQRFLDLAVFNYADLVQAPGNRIVMQVVHSISSFLYAAPVSNAAILAYFKAAGRDRDRVVASLIKTCGADAPTMERRIYCLTTRIHDYVVVLPSMNGITYDARTKCTIAANLFVLAFNGMKIPRAIAGYRAASVKLPALHVVNQIVLTATDGRQFGYIVDVGIAPDIFFPTSMHSLAHHDPNDDGEIDVTDFPALNFQRPPTRTEYRAAK
ncbi:MAG: hypothetical protein AAB250_04490, partial [Bdellovibrionota bacterium]